MALNKYKYYCRTHGWTVSVHETTPTTCVTGGEPIYSIIDEGTFSVNDGTPLDSGVSLAEYKQLRYNEIDYNTGVLIAPGFTYDSNTFSTSAMAQQNWSSIKENQSDYTFPLLVSTKDSNEYSLAEADVVAFWTAGRDFVKGHLDSGRSLKKSIFDAVDKAGVDAVIDNR